jgi:hypothetical protein
LTLIRYYILFSFIQGAKRGKRRERTKGTRRTSSMMKITH